MSKVRAAFAACLLMLAITASANLSEVPSGDYGLDKTHGYITFSYSHLGFSNPHVGFKSFEVDLNLDNENVSNSSVSVTIDATSIDSRVDKFNEHLNGQNFFDTSNHPTITFNSTSVESAGENKLSVTGDLTIKGHTESVTLAATINKAANHPMRKVPTIGISAEAKVSRSAFGMSTAAPNVGDEVTIYIDVELPKKRAE